MKLTHIKLPAAALALTLISASYAGTFTDNFDTTRNFKTSGVAGTHWSGMTAGSVNPGTVSAWDANITAPGTLTITNSGGSWVDTGDGPYLWTTVSGDFTNTVHVSRLDQINYNFAGLLVRDPASLGNWFYLSVFAEYGFEIDWRDTIDGASTEGTSIGAGYVETNSATWRSWLQITRVNGILDAYVSANGVDWELVYESTRTDLTNDLQVGVFDSTYSANVCSAQFQNFSITGPNVNSSTPPAQVTGLTVTSLPASLDVSWTKGAGSDGSIVVVRRAKPITRQPLDGMTYTGDATFGAGDDLGESNYVVYVGSGSSVIITNLVPSVQYSVAAYSYSGSGTNTLYAINDAPYMTGVPNGTPTGIVVSFVKTNAVAVDDTIQAQVQLWFDVGVSIDVTESSTFSSSAPGMASVSASGLISGLAAGTVTITATNGAFIASSNLTIVKVPVTDDFSTPRNYLTQGVVGTFWSGLRLNTNDLNLSIGESSSFNGTETLIADANMTTPGRLTVSTHDGGYAIGDSAGFFLYRVVNGDFSISIQIPQFQGGAGFEFHMPGLMVRAPFELLYTESFYQLQAFNNYGIGNFSRRAINGTYGETYFTGQPAEQFIMIQRETNTFKFYQKAHALDEWTLLGSEDRPEWDGVPMQVGIVDQTFTANTASSEFDNLIFTVPGGLSNNVSAPSAPTGLVLTSNDVGNVTVNWTAGAGSDGSVVIAHTPNHVTRQPADGDDLSGSANSDFLLALDLGANNRVVYAGSGMSVNVSDLPAAPCYFAVYSYSTVGGTNFYNLLNPLTGSIDFTPPPPPDVNVSIASMGNGVFQLSWPQGTLLEATNILGPWQTNLTVSPLLITNPVGNKFFRLQLQ